MTSSTLAEHQQVPDADIISATAQALRQALDLTAKCTHPGVSDYQRRGCELHELRRLVGMIATQLEQRGQR